MNIDEIVKVNDKVIIDMTAPWCAPCKQMEPILEKVEEETDIKVVKVDVDEHPDIAELYGISSVPTTIYYRDGEQLESKVGTQSFATILNVFA